MATAGRRAYRRWREIRAAKFSPAELARMDAGIAIRLLSMDLAEAGLAAYFGADPHDFVAAHDS